MTTQLAPSGLVSTYPAYPVVALPGLIAIGWVAWCASTDTMNQEGEAESGLTAVYDASILRVGLDIRVYCQTRV